MRFLAALALLLASPTAFAQTDMAFAPGERTLFEETFDEPGAFGPPEDPTSGRLVFEEGAMMQMEWEGQGALAAMEYGGFAVPLPEALPERFTMEFDVVLDGRAPWAEGELHHDANRASLAVTTTQEGGESVFVYNLMGDVGFAGERMTPNEARHHGERVRLALAVDGPQARAFVDGEPVLSLNTASFTRGDMVHVSLTTPGGIEGFVTRIRIAAD